MTPIEFALLAVWLGFGIRAGWMACDALIEAVSALVAAIDRRRFRRMLAKDVERGEVVREAFHAMPQVGVVNVVNHPFVGEITPDFPRPRSHG